MKNKCNDEFKVKGIYSVNKKENNGYKSASIPLPSKSQLKKCNKGLHEFKESVPIKVSEYLYETKWNCMYCGISINNR
jgi:hypothetical protein